MASETLIESEKPTGTPAEVFAQLLDGSIDQLAPENAASLDLPSDELHQEILLPLLPAMLGDKAIRDHWREQKSTGFLARLQSHLDAGAERPRWTAGDFEIHVTSSYSAGPDARALADTLLSEDSLRDLAAALMNQILAPVWERLPRAVAPAAVPPSQREETAAVPKPREEEIAAPASPAPEVPAEPALPVARPISPAPLVVGTVLRMPPFRPQPWRARRNPLSGIRGAATVGFANPLARNPLEQRSAPRHVLGSLRLR